MPLMIILSGVESFLWPENHERDDDDSEWFYAETHIQYKQHKGGETFITGERERERSKKKVISIQTRYTTSIEYKLHRDTQNGSGGERSKEDKHHHHDEMREGMNGKREKGGKRSGIMIQDRFEVESSSAIVKEPLFMRRVAVRCNYSYCPWAASHSHRLWSSTSSWWRCSL